MSWTEQIVITLTLLFLAFCAAFNIDVVIAHNGRAIFNLGISIYLIAVIIRVAVMK